MKHLKTFENISRKYFYKELYNFLKSIARTDLGHKVIKKSEFLFLLVDNNGSILIKVYDDIHIYNNQNQLKDYPNIKEYLESKIPIENGTLFTIDINNIPEDFKLDVNEYETFKNQIKYNL